VCVCVGVCACVLICVWEKIMLVQFEQNNGSLHTLFISFRNVSHLCFLLRCCVSSFSTVLRGVTPCRAVDQLQRFVHNFCFHLQSPPWSWRPKLSTKLQAVTTQNLYFYCFKVQLNTDIAPPLLADIAPALILRPWNSVRKKFCNIQKLYLPPHSVWRHKLRWHKRWRYIGVWP